MARAANDMELLIDEYVDGRLEERKRAEFEAHLADDPELRRKVQTATQSLEVLRSVLTQVAPSPEFEGKVSSQIVSITQSNPNLRPGTPGKRPTKLTAGDADARLLSDPSAERERRRLMLVAAVAAVLFAAAVVVVVLVFLQP